MSEKAVRLVLVLAVALAATACQKLPVPSATGSQIGVEELAQSNMIPASWGDLVAVSTIGDIPDRVQLWFQDEQKVIRVVQYRQSTRDLVAARVIRRN